MITCILPSFLTIKPRNPFKFGSVVSEDYFTDRQAEYEKTAHRFYTKMQALRVPHSAHWNDWPKKAFWLKRKITKSMTRFLNFGLWKSGYIKFNRNNIRPPLQNAFRTRQFVVENISLDCRFERARKSFENAFDFVMFVVAFGFDIEIHFCTVW